MSTYTTTIEGALQLIGVLPESQSASADQAADALVILNDLMAAWESVGLNVGHVPSANAADTMDYPANARMAIKASLAMALCPSYDRQPSPVLVSMATATLNRLMSDAIYKQVKPTNLDTLSSQREVSFIESGP